MASVLDSTNYLATLNELKTYIGVPLQDSGDDNRLEEAINAASRIANTFTNRDLRARAVTLYLDGPGGTKLQLPNWPVNATTSIHDSTDVPRVWTADTLVSSDDYIVDTVSGIVYLEASEWSDRPQSIRYIGDLGYGYSSAAIPHDLKRAVLQVAAKLWAQERDGLDGKTAVTTGQGSSLSLDTAWLTPYAERVFELYRRMTD